MIEKDELNMLYSRIEDLCNRAQKGTVGITSFLSPRELALAQSYLKTKGEHFFSDGGYEAAERKRIYVLPDYLEEIDSILDFCAIGNDSETAALLISGSGFERLSHRAVMGSVLGLGVEREVIGDIVMENEQRAFVFCDCSIARFLCAELKRVGRDTVKLQIVSRDRVVLPPRKFISLSDTVASPRLDCVVASVCSLSREKARAAVESGLAELDYKTESRPDKAVLAPCILSVRGYGKFKILSVDEKTKKGRYRLFYEKFV